MQDYLFYWVLAEFLSLKKNKDQVELAVNDFKKGYLKEKTSENGFNALVNLIACKCNFK